MRAHLSKDKRVAVIGVVRLDESTSRRHLAELDLVLANVWTGDVGFEEGNDVLSYSAQRPDRGRDTTRSRSRSHLRHDQRWSLGCLGSLLHHRLLDRCLLLDGCLLRQSGGFHREDARHGPQVSCRPHAPDRLDKRLEQMEIRPDLAHLLVIMADLGHDRLAGIGCRWEKHDREQSKYLM